MQFFWGRLLPTARKGLLTVCSPLLLPARVVSERPISRATCFLSGVHKTHKEIFNVRYKTAWSMTMDIYSHMLPGMQQDAVSKLDQAMKQTYNKSREEEK
jgi:hypothetical protein